jgi:hypothetical protein
LPESIVFQAEWTEENQHLQETGYYNFSITEIFFRALFDPLFVFKLLLKPCIRPLVGRAVLGSQGFSQEMIENAKRTWKINWEVPIEKYINLLKAQDDLDGRMRMPSYYENIRKPVIDRRRFFTPTPLDLTTPDGAQVRGMFYKTTKTEALDIPTIVIFQPNAGIHRQGMVNPFLDFGVEHRTPFNVAIIDYRGTGDSIIGADPNKQRLEFANQLILDGDTLHQCLQKGLGVSENNIRYYGYSLGGAVSAHVRALHHSNAPYVNSHSFTTLNDLLHKSDFVDRSVELLQKLLRGERAAPPGMELNEENQEGGGGCCCCSLLAWVLSADWLRRFATDLITFCDLDFNVPKALDEIDENHVLVVHDEEDEFMQFAGTYQCVPEERQLAVTHNREDGNHHMSLFHEMVIDDESRELAGPHILSFLTQKV